MKEAFAVEWVGHNITGPWPQMSMQRLYVRAANAGTRAWRAGASNGAEGAGGAEGAEGDHVGLEFRVNGEVREVAPLPHDVPPGGRVTFSFPMLVPMVSFTGRGEVRLGLHFVAGAGPGGDAGGGGQGGSAGPLGVGLEVPVEVGPVEGGPAAEALQAAGVACNAFYLPSGGVSRGRDGRLYPLIARHAQGCRVRDVEGNEWIDYVMGWGAALLGYARPEISDAIRAELGSGAVLGLPHFLELEVALLLGELIPCAETTLFGKNGSDVCTAAVRMARVYTARPKILFSGYSGWQEPFATVFEPGLAQPGHPPTAFRFPANDLSRVDALLAEHEGQVAAVMVEPAAREEAVDGPMRPADAVFLGALAERCRRHGALLIFDEIFTGFRYPGGSAQKATGVVPDLACFGKALASGMPLSVLVGRRDVMKSVAGIFYHPTFKGEAYSFAAAAAALRIYQREDVPARVEAFGTKLMDAVNQSSRRLGVDGRMQGLPMRMVYRFAEPDESRRALMRTLLQQELMKRGVLPFRGILVPGTAHGEAELQRTAEAFESALRVVQEAAEGDCFERRLEIPPIV